MRPIHHQTPRRTQAHIFVAALAFLLDRALEKKLKAAGIDISSQEAWEILKTVRVVEFTLSESQSQRQVTRGSARADRILKVVGIRNLDPKCRGQGEEKGRIVTHAKTRPCVFNKLARNPANMR